jgi:hypothetical protein
MTVTLAEGDGGAVDVFWEKDSAGKRVIGADISHVLGVDASISFWQTYTYVQGWNIPLPKGFAAEAMAKLI